MKKQKQMIIIILLVLCIMILAIIDYRKGEEVIKKTPEELCSDIEATPAWVHENNIVNYGYKGNVDQDGNSLIEFLIENKIYMLYSSECGWCKKQIEDFGEDWGRYVEAGLTINCMDVNK